MKAMDDNKIKEGVRLILEGVGEDITREGLIETPDRIARMYHELAAGYEDDPAVHLSKRFHAGSSDMVVEKDITFYSFCEHHMLPFFGKAAVAYVPDGEVVGLSKIARTVEVYARRFQLQERLTSQIADAFMKGRDGSHRGRAHVHEHERNKKAGRKDRNFGHSGRL